ncbi:MAG: TPM domain-containing protein [Flammeovirgaceae bacterium]|nr:TPM domain-containing protein [Flammeovirgaceae bacterium]
MRVKNFLLILLVTLPGILLGQRSIPSHGGVWVHDEAGVIDPSIKTELEYILKQERDSTSNQIGVLVIPSLDGDDIDEYANRVFKEWKLGQAGKDNGVLFLIALEDKKMRIEVGYGLEGALTDMRSSQINRNEVAPFFRQGQYGEGVKAGVMGIIQSIKGEYKNENPVKRIKKKRSPWVTIVIIIIFIIIASRRRGGGGGYWSSGGGFLGPMLGGGFGRSGGSWGSGSDFGGGGFSGGGGSSDSW